MVGGKPSFVGFGDVEGEMTGLFIEWDDMGSPPAWIIVDGFGAVLFKNTQDTDLPPGTDQFAWTAVDPIFTCNSDPSTLSVTGSSVFLPVSWLSFELRDESKSGVQLEWTTATEQDNLGFTAQRSTDGTSWQDLGFVRASNDRGTTEAISTYNFIDTNAPLSGRVFYRLQQEDFDGTLSFSEVRALSRDNIGGVSVWPNPVRGSLLNISTPAGDPVDAEVIDQLGRSVLRFSKITNSLDVNELPAGSYTLRLFSNTSDEAIRFVRQ